MEARSMPLHAKLFSLIFLLPNLSLSLSLSLSLFLYVAYFFVWIEQEALKANCVAWERGRQKGREKESCMHACRRRK
jgi:hypothetical protein